MLQSSLSLLLLLLSQSSVLQHFQKYLKKKGREKGEPEEKILLPQVMNHSLWNPYIC